MIIGNPIFVGGTPPEITLFNNIFGVHFPFAPRTIPHVQLILEKIESELSALILPTGTLSMLHGEPIPIDILPFRPEEEPGVTYKRYHMTLYPANDVFSEEPRIELRRHGRTL